MKFKFKLQTVLNVKENLLKQTQQELAELLAKKLEQQQRLKQLESEIAVCSEKINEKESFSPGEIKIQYDYYYDLMDLVELQTKEILDMEIRSESD